MTLDTWGFHPKISQNLRLHSHISFLYFQFGFEPPNRLLAFGCSKERIGYVWNRRTLFKRSR